MVDRTKPISHRWTKPKLSNGKDPDLTVVDGLGVPVGKGNISKRELECGLSRVKDL